MKIYPRKFKALSLSGNNVFPIYAADGSVSMQLMSVVFDGDPPLSTLGLDDLVVKVGEGYRYVIIKFDECIGASRLAQKVEQAEQLLENSK